MELIDRDFKFYIDTSIYIFEDDDGKRVVCKNRMHGEYLLLASFLHGIPAFVFHVRRSDIPIEQTGLSEVTTEDLITYAYDYFFILDDGNYNMYRISIGSGREKRPKSKAIKDFDKLIERLWDYKEKEKQHQNHLSE